tara:strand:- start:2000 stop:2227 length:228 start_codon:yes stop_codon:yes gene_type:complete
MLKDKYHILSELELCIQESGYEYQSIGNEIRIYLDESEIYIVINKYINIHEHNNVDPYTFSNLNDAIKKLKSIIF